MSIFKKIGKIIGTAAPILGTVVGGPFGAAAGGLIASALGVDNDEQAIMQAIENDPQAMLKIKEIEVTHKGELEKLYAQTIALEVREHHQTYRTELMSSDRFVRWWRPAFGWACVICFLLQFTMYIAGTLYGVFFVPDAIGDILNGLAELTSSLTVIWGIAFSVLGINITSRSRDKQLVAGKEPDAGIVQSLLAKFAR